MPSVDSQYWGVWRPVWMGAIPAGLLEKLVLALAPEQQSMLDIHSALTASVQNRQ